MPFQLTFLKELLHTRRRTICQSLFIHTNISLTDVCLWFLQVFIPKSYMDIHSELLRAKKGFLQVHHSVREKMANCNWMALMMCVLIFVGCFTIFQCYQLNYFSKPSPEIDFWPQDILEFFKIKSPTIFLCGHW